MLVTGRAGSIGSYACKARARSESAAGPNLNKGLEFRQERLSGFRLNTGGPGKS